MKKNVYDQVHIFYDESIMWDSTIKLEWVEGFLRQKAWQGTSDDNLKDLWRQIQIFIIYLNDAENDDLSEMTLLDYSLAIEWLANHMTDFKANLKSARHIFSVLIDFYTYLFQKKIINNVDEIKEAAQIISGGKRLHLIKSDSMFDELRVFEDNLDDKQNKDIGSIISDATERLMLKLGKYFHRKIFTEDFERALYFYIGPFDKVPEDAEDEFWLGFWDYFLFDYHLLDSDLKPLEFFKRSCGEKLNADEYRILQELLNSKFTAFYVNKILNSNSVECLNLFTGEKFDLPLIDFNYKSLKKLLFFGHIFPTGLVMINYLTSIEISINLRQRIKDEVLRQKQIFAIQVPNATLEDFFERHALVLRHTVRILVTLSKVNVTSLVQLERDFPHIEAKRLANQDVIHLLHELVASYGFSLQDQNLLGKMWYDFSQLNIINVRKPATWATAVFYAYTVINCIDDVTAKDLAERLDVSTTSLHKNRKQLDHILQLQAFDARYLSEEGFVNLLFEE